MFNNKYENHIRKIESILNIPLQQSKIKRKNLLAFAIDLFGNRKEKLSDSDFCLFLQSISSAIRTGADPIIAFTLARDLYDKTSKIRMDLESFQSAIDTGSSFEEALNAFCRSCNHPDIKILKNIFLISFEHGSPLYPSLQRLLKSIRQRESASRRLRSALALQNLSCYGMAFCTVLMLFIQIIGNHEAVKEAFHNPAGVKLYAFGITLILTGIAWMFCMSKKRWG